MNSSSPIRREPLRAASRNLIDLGVAYAEPHTPDRMEGMDLCYTMVSVSTSILSKRLGTLKNSELPDVADSNDAYGTLVTCG